jgi:WD40 repeat protein
MVILKVKCKVPSGLQKMVKPLDCLEKVQKISIHKDLIAYALDNSIQVTDLQFQTLHSYQTGSPCTGLEWSPQSGNDVILAASFIDRLVLFFNNQVFEMGKITCNSLKFNANGSLLATTGDDKMVRIWSVQKEGEPFQIPLKSRGCSVDWNPHNSQLLIGESNGDVRVFDFHSKEFVFSIMHPYLGQLIIDLKWNPVDPVVFGGIVGDKFLIWNIEKNNIPEHHGLCLGGRKFIWNNHPSRLFSIQGINDIKMFATVFTKGNFC